jgi:hypothetical protein
LKDDIDQVLIGLVALPLPPLFIELISCAMGGSIFNHFKIIKQGITIKHMTHRNMRKQPRKLLLSIPTTSFILLTHTVCGLVTARSVKKIAIPS